MSSQNIDEIEDEDLLYGMLNKTENFDDRKKIRARIRDIRDKKTEEFERRKQEREANLEDAVTLRQRQAAASKTRKMQVFADQAKDGKKDTGIVEQGMRERRMRADEDKKKKIEQLNEMGRVMSSALNEGVNMVKHAEEAAAKKLQEKKEQEDAVFSTTKTEKNADGGTTTTSTSTTRQTTKDGSTTTMKQTKQVTQVGGIGGTQYSVNKPTAAKTNQRGGAMQAFKQMDAANPPAGGGSGPAKPNYLAAPGGGRGRGVTVQRSPSAIKQMLLDWCKAMTKEYEPDVTVTNFSSSWNDGMAFCALIHHFHPEAFDFKKLNPKNRRGNFALAFDTAEKYADIAPLLEVDDMVRMKNPDWKCVFCYIQSFYRKFREVSAKPPQEAQ